MRVADEAKTTMARLEARHPPLALLHALFRKHTEDRRNYLAAIVAYYAFLSIFPLMLVFVTVLGYALHGDADLQDSVLNSALADFPVIGPQLKNNVHSLQGSGLALLIGVGIALWAGTGVCLALEHAFDQIWEVPSKRRANFVGSACEHWLGSACSAWSRSSGRSPGRSAPRLRRMARASGSLASLSRSP